MFVLKIKLINESKKYKTKMERQIYFETKPEVAPWGEKAIVPLNVTEHERTDENGQTKKYYRADLVKKVEKPLTVDTIVQAAVDEDFDDAAQKRIMRNFAKTDDAEVSSYKKLVTEVTEAAKKAGYK